MIGWLFSTTAGWVRERSDGLVLIALVIEASLALILIRGIGEVVSGLSEGLLLLYALLGISLTRLLMLWNVSTFKKILLLVLVGIGVAVIISATLWRPFLTMALRLVTYPDVRFSPTPFEGCQVITEAASQIIARGSAFGGELYIWGYQVFSGAPTQLEQPRQFMWGVAVFAVVSWASWLLNVHNRPFLAVLPMSAFLGYLVETNDDGYISFGLLVAFSFVAIALFSHLQREKCWERSGLSYSMELRLDIGWITGLMGLLIFVIAAFTPSISVKEILDRIEDARNPVEESHISSSGPQDEDQFQLGEGSGSIGSLPSSHLISGSPNLLDMLLYQIWVEGGGEIQGSFPGKWRTHTYQEYTGRGWLAGEVTAQQFGPSEIVAATIPSRQPSIQLTVSKTSESAEGPLVHAAQLIQVSQPAVVQWRDTPSGWQDYSSGTVEGQVYTVEVTWPAPGEDVLRVTDFDYPDWIAARYLQLPELTPRVAALSDDFERTYEDPYSRAQAIEAYLREFPYTLDVPLPPQDRDIVDYFLFDLQQGYCDYFATAMVVLARSAGLPARMVGGYARGDYDSRTTAYLVSGEDAHTWVEIYFNRIGWIEFEPTPARLLVSRESEIVSEHQPEELEEEKFSLKLPEINMEMLLPALLLILPLLLFFILNRFQYQFLQKDVLLRMTRERLYNLAEQFGVSNPKSATLNEIRDAVLETSAFSSRSWPVRRVFDRGYEVVSASTALLQDAAYRGRPPEDFSRGILIRNILQARRITGFLRVVNQAQRTGRDHQ